MSLAHASYHPSTYMISAPNQCCLLPQQHIASGRASGIYPLPHHSRLLLARQQVHAHPPQQRSGSGVVSSDTQSTCEQQQRRKQQRLRRLWEQQFADCVAWQELYLSPAFLKQPLTHNKTVILTAAAARIARLLKQQPEEDANADQQQQHQDEQQQQQQHSQLQQQTQAQQGAEQLWHWYRATVLQPCCHLPAPPASQQQQQQGEFLDTVTAAAVLQATVHMGWCLDTIAALTGSRDGKTARQLQDVCVTLYDAGLRAALPAAAQPDAAAAADNTNSNASSSSSDTTAPTSPPQPPDNSHVLIACPPVAVINLVTAMQALRVPVACGFHQWQLQQQALLAAFSSSSSGSSSARLGHPAVVKLLQSCVLHAGDGVSTDVLVSMVGHTKAHTRQHPQQYLQLLCRLSNLEQQLEQQQQQHQQQLEQQHQGAAAGPQLLQDFKLLLLPQREFQHGNFKKQLVETLQYQIVLKLFGRQQRVFNLYSSRSSSDTRGDNSGGASSSSSSSSVHARQRLSAGAMKELLRPKKLPNLQCSFQEVTLLSCAVAQLPSHPDLVSTKKLLMRAGLQCLARSAAAARGNDTSSSNHSSRGSNYSRSSSSGVAFGGRESTQPSDISHWLQAIVSMRVWMSDGHARALAGLLLEQLSDAAAAAAAAAAHGDAVSIGDEPRKLAAAGSASHSTSSSSRGWRRGRTAWSPDVVVPLLVAACDLRLLGPSLPEWWPVVLRLVLSQQQQYSPDQLLLVLQCMMRAQYHPDHEQLGQLVAQMSGAWLPGSSPAAAGRGARGSGGRSRTSSAQRSRSSSTQAQPTLSQLLDLLSVLAFFKHRPQASAAATEQWWAAYQDALLTANNTGSQQGPEASEQQLGVFQQQLWQREQELQQLGEQVPTFQQAWWHEQQGLRMQQQLQQLDVAAAAKIVWTLGRLRLCPEERLLSLLLSLLQQSVWDLDTKQTVGVVVGMASLLKSQPDALSSSSGSSLWVQLCQQLRDQDAQPTATDAANLIRAFGSIAETTKGDGAAAAASGGEPQRQRQQQQLLPPRDLVEWLLLVVEPGLQQLSDQGLSMLIWGLRKLGHRPGQRWLSRYQAVVLERATANPGLPDHVCAIITASLVHLDLPVNGELLQQLLFRTPRRNMSAGILADLTAALKKLEDGGASALLQQQEEQQQKQDALPLWEQQQRQQQQEQRQQQRYQQHVQQQQQRVAAQSDSGSVGGGVNAGDSLDGDIDSLVDSARLRLVAARGGAAKHPGGTAEPDSDGFVPLSVARNKPAAVTAKPRAAAAADGGGDGGGYGDSEFSWDVYDEDEDDMLIDEATKKRLIARMAAVEELMWESGGG